jgi:hypothetical protein
MLVPSFQLLASAAVTALGGVLLMVFAPSR